MQDFFHQQYLAGIPTSYVYSQFRDCLYTANFWYFAHLSPLTAFNQYPCCWHVVSTCFNQCPSPNNKNTNKPLRKKITTTSRFKKKTPINRLVQPIPKMHTRLQTNLWICRCHTLYLEEVGVCKSSENRSQGGMTGISTSWDKLEVLEAHPEIFGFFGEGMKMWIFVFIFRITEYSNLVKQKWQFNSFGHFVIYVH